MKKILLVISDLHVGSTVGLCPRDGLMGDDGVRIQPSRFQQGLCDAFDNLIQRTLAIKKVNKRALIVNGDSVDGSHHNTVALMTNNIDRQEAGAAEILGGISKHFDRIYVNRGTEAHVQQSAQSEERVARAINAEKDELGNHSAWQLWLEVEGLVFNVAHHISTTSSAAYESSAVMRELVAAMVEAGQWGQKVPNVLLRSHRHRYIELNIPSQHGNIKAAVTPGFQLRTPFVEKIDRLRLPNIGGLIVIVEDGLCQIIPIIYPFKGSAIRTF